LLEEAKNHLKVDGEEDNVLIGTFITAAREIAEQETSRALITQTWRMFLDESPEEIEIPKAPLQSVDSIKAISEVQSYVDETSAAAQPVLKVGSTVGFTIADTIAINRGGTREEELIILSIQPGISLTMTINLANEHTLAQADLVEKYILVSKTSYLVDLPEDSVGRIKLKSGCTWPTHREFASFIVEFKSGYGDAGSDLPAPLRREILTLVKTFYDHRGITVISSEDLRAMFDPFKTIYL